MAVGISMPADPSLPEAVHNQSCLVIGGVYVGDVDEGMKVLQPLRELGTPLADISGPTPFVGVNSAFDPFFPMGTYQSYWKAQNLDTLPDEALAVIAAKADSRPSPVTLAVVFHMGGAINRVGSADTAYGERTAQWMSSFDGNWEDPNDNDANIAWVRDAFDQVARYGKGSTYTNFTGQADETADALARNAYGPNTARLRAIKKQYDPDLLVLEAERSSTPLRRGWDGSRTGGEGSPFPDTGVEAVRCGSISLARRGGLDRSARRVEDGRSTGLGRHERKPGSNDPVTDSEAWSRPPATRCPSASASVRISSPSPTAPGPSFSRRSLPRFATAPSTGDSVTSAR